MPEMIDLRFHILDAMTGGGPFNTETAEIDLDNYVAERVAVATRNLEAERDILIGQVKMKDEDILRLRTDNDKMRNTIGWYQDRDMGDGPPEEWRVW